MPLISETVYENHDIGKSVIVFDEEATDGKKRKSKPGREIEIMERLT